MDKDEMIVYHMMNWLNFERDLGFTDYSILDQYYYAPTLEHKYLIAIIDDNGVIHGIQIAHRNLAGTIIPSIDEDEIEEVVNCQNGWTHTLSYHPEYTLRTHPELCIKFMEELKKNDEYYGEYHYDSNGIIPVELEVELPSHKNGDSIDHPVYGYTKIKNEYFHSSCDPNELVKLHEELKSLCNIKLIKDHGALACTDLIVNAKSERNSGLVLYVIKNKEYYYAKVLEWHYTESMNDEMDEHDFFITKSIDELKVFIDGIVDYVNGQRECNGLSPLEVDND